MEYAPWTPTPEERRESAMREYVAGEALCDANHTQDGLKKLRNAARLAWELEQQHWPAWAHTLYKRLHGEPQPTTPIPLLHRAHLQRVGPPRPADGGLWWRREPDALARIGIALAERNFVVVDGLLGETTRRSLAQAAAQAWEEGVLHPAKVASLGNGSSGEQSVHTRTDCIAFVDPASSGKWAPLASLCREVDDMCRALRDTPSYGLASITSRQSPMVSRYDVGARFARHSDSHCVRGCGPFCNGRVLTAVYYLQDDWTPADGGCLRLYRSQQVEDTGDEVNELCDELVDVPPVGDRLLLFLSDTRCPHEVLEAHSVRYAVTLWYMDSSRPGSVELPKLQ